MSRFNYHYLAILPLLTILTMSPAEVKSTFASRTIASEVTAAHPKYESRAAKIDRSKIEIDKDLDLNCFSDRAEALRTRLMDMRKGYKVDLVEKDAVAAQRAQVEGLVSALVSLEVDFKALKDKKAFVPDGEKIAEGTVNEFKTTLESLLIDEMENELNVLKAEAKPEAKPETPKPGVATEESKPVIDYEKQICELEDKNEALTKQVEELMTQQKSITETLLGMNKMMVQMHQQMQQQQQIPQWMMNGSMMNYHQLYPSNHGTTIIMVGGNSQPWVPNVHTQSPQLGNSAYQQAAQSPNLQLSQPTGNSYLDYDQRFSTPAPVQSGVFGDAPFIYNFGPTQFNSAPTLSA